MGKKRGRQPDIEDILARPWCYYCERDFEDLKLLISHQKAKHFKCDKCGRRLNTAGGLAVHLNQVHKETLEHVDNALSNRQALDVEIFGMEGIPAEVLETHRNRLISTFYTAQEDRRKLTGNPLPGQPIIYKKKKLHFETALELKKRLNEWRAKRKTAANSAMDGVITGTKAFSYNNNTSTNQQPPPQTYAFNNNPDSTIPGRPPTTTTSGFAGLPQRPVDTTTQHHPQGDDIDNLIRMAEAGIKPPVPATAAAVESSSKKKEKGGGRMIYDDIEVSPEERLAMVHRYASTQVAV